MLKEMMSLNQRCCGLLLGLCAGDRNGGPLRMARVLLTTVLQRKDSSASPEQGLVDTDALIAAYEHWFRGDDAYDYGTVFGMVFGERLRRHVAKTSTLPGVREGSSDSSALSFSPGGLSRAEHDVIVRAVFERTNSSGVNPAHRNVVLSVVRNGPLESVSSLALAAAAEAQLSHLHPSSVWTSVAVNVLCRHIILGASLCQAIDQTLLFLEERTHGESNGSFAEADVDAIREIRDLLRRTTGSASEESQTSWLHTGGCSPKVLATAIHFVASTTSFEEALEQSLTFAGPANYCPVLVGAIAGGIYGADAIPARALQHRQLTPELVESMRSLGMAAASGSAGPAQAN